MSGLKQILATVVILVLAGAGWAVWERPAFLFGASESATGAGGGQGTAAAPTRGGPVLVVAEPVATDDAGESARAIGTLQAAQEVTLYPQVSGVVTKIAFKAGDRVAAEQLLLQLDDRDQAVEVERATIALADATGARDRAERLGKNGNATTVTISTARSAEDRARIDKTRAELEFARRGIRAPFAGTVGLTDLSVGDVVTTATPIATVSDVSSVTVAFEVPERLSARVKVGDPVTATATTMPGSEFTGAISAIDSRIDATSRTLRVEAELTNDANLLKPGMAVATTLAYPAEARPSIPSLALQWDREGSFVWTIDGDHARRTPVTIVSRRSGTVTVVGALAPGDLVVVEGIQRLREGAVVTRLDGDEDKTAAATPAGDG